MIVKKSDGYYVMSQAGKKLSGPYKTKSEANKQLNQVEFLKKHEHGGKLEGLLKGPSHDNGGVKFTVKGQLQEAEGGEYVVRKEAVEQLKKLHGEKVFDEFINKGILPNNRNLT
jgi:hypothetical protein|tara:strand:- start:9213 stop:9554 length:342 start_codon:yes stop_codon:yes gene_type:complete